MNQDSEEDKPAWRKAMNKVQDFVTDPDTKRFAKAGSQVLEVASQLGQSKLKGPWGIAGAAIGVLDVLANHTSSNGIYSAINDRVAKRGLRPIDSSGAVALLFEQGYFMNSQVLVPDEHYSFVTVPIGDGHEIAVVLDKNGSLAPWFNAYISEELSTAMMAKVLWSNLGEAITLTFRKDEFENETLSATPIDGFEDNEYIGPKSPEDFIEKFHKYRKAGIRRAYLAVGPPGGGKTTFCFKCARLLGGKMLAITPDLLENQKIPRQDIVELVGTFRPSVLLFEDVDRISKDGLLLSLMDFVRQKSPETLMMSTANKAKDIIDALKRPGRLGPQLDFLAPDLEWRNKVIDLYTNKVGLGRDLKHLAEFMDHKQFTQDYIKEVCEQAVVEDDEELKAYISRTIESFSEEESKDSKDEGETPVLKKAS